MLKRFCSLIFVAAAVAACSDSSLPTGVIPTPLDANQAVLAQLTCRVDAVASTMSCGPAGPSTASGRSNDLILGGQNIYVKMTSANVTTTAGVSVTANVTVKNLTSQPWSTGNGATADTAGVKVFFQQLPTPPVVISNPTDSAAFTGSAKQPFFEYTGALLGGDGILSPGETSLPINWNFQLNGQTTFSFSVLIIAKMPDETGALRWVQDTLAQAGAAEYLLSVWGSSATDVWTGGAAGSTAFHHYDGASWTTAAWPNEVSGIWGTSSSNVYAVSATNIAKYNGASWAPESFTAPNALFAIWGTSGTDIYAGGSAATLVHYDGANWSNVASSGLAGNEAVTAIWGTSSTNVYVGTASATAGLGLHRWNGTSWSTVAAGINAVRAIWGSSSTDIYVGGDFGFLRHWNGVSWSTIGGFGSADTDGIQGIWGSAANNVFLVQRNGKIWRSFDLGVTWFPYANTGVNLLAIWGADNRNIFAVGFGSGGTFNNIAIRGIH